MKDKAGGQGVGGRLWNGKAAAVVPKTLLQPFV